LGYLRGLASYLLIADGTRRSTLEIARGFKHVSQMIALSPFLLISTNQTWQRNGIIDDEMITGAGKKWLAGH
jgi:hypothetical protein